MSLKIYISSAGSGKTHSLATEYIKLCFKSPNYFKNILAITFTNKATEEMKNRILEYLVLLSSDEGLKERKIKNLVETLKDLGLNDNLIKSTAGNILRNILYNYTNFSISTIDSFFSRILRSFSKELHLPSNYEIELDEQKVLNEIIKNLWIKAAEDALLFEYLNKFAHYRLAEGKSWNIDDSLFKVGTEIFRDRYWDRYWERIFKDEYKDIHSREKIDDFIKKLKTIKFNFEKNLEEKAKEAEKIIESSNLSINDFSGGNNRSIPAKILRLKNLKDLSILDSIIKSKDALDDDKKWYTQKSDKQDIIVGCLNSGLRDLFNDIITIIENDLKEYISAKIILDYIHVFGVFKDLINILKLYENEESVILSSNISRRLINLVSDYKPSFIFEKIGNTYINFLIDEFQDTSTIQWKVLKPLISESLSKSDLSLVVGDPKQSIYRWRDGNMSLILKDIYEDFKMYSDKIQKEELKTNYRSSKIIIEFNNSFFKEILVGTGYVIKSREGIDLFEATYDKIIEQEANKKDENNGYVNITLIEKNKDTSDNQKDEDINLDEIVLNKVKEIIREALSRNYKQSDITILIRKTKEGTEIAKNLIDEGWNVISPDSLNILNSPKVNFLLSILKFIVNQKDNLSIAEFINSYLRYIEGKSLENHTILSLFNEFVSEKELKENILYDYIPNTLKEEQTDYFLPSYLYNYNIYELVENLIRIFSLNKEPDLYILKFLDIIKEYSRNNSTDIQSFLNWFDTIKETENSSLLSISSPENTEAIKISTIHKIKGLQNKIVIIPYANWEIQLIGSRDIIWVSSKEEPFNKYSALPVFGRKDLENSYFSEDYNLENDLTLIDNLNLLYVAFTRAEDALFVISSEKNKNTINDIIKNKINKLEKFFEKPTNEKRGNYVINSYSKGCLVDKKNYEDILEVNSIKSEIKFISSQWYKNIVIKTADLENKPWEENYNKIHRGIKIHKILSRLINADDLDSVLKEELTRENINKQEAQFIKQIINQFLNTDESKAIFDNNYKVLTEAEIITPENLIIRPDRILIKDNELKIIDFKIGKESKEHIEQISNYEKILREAGYKVSEKYIVYLTDEIKIMKI